MLFALIPPFHNFPLLSTCSTFMKHEDAPKVISLGMGSLWNFRYLLPQIFLACRHVHNKCRTFFPEEGSTSGISLSKILRSAYFQGRLTNARLEILQWCVVSYGWWCKQAKYITWAENRPGVYRCLTSPDMAKNTIKHEFSCDTRWMSHNLTG